MSVFNDRQPHIREARCGSCDEIFNPCDDDDLIHCQRENGDRCGGQGTMTGAYYLGTVDDPGLTFVPASTSSAGSTGPDATDDGPPATDADSVPTDAGPVPPVVTDAVAAYATARQGAASVDPPTVDVAVLLRRAIYREST